MRNPKVWSLVSGFNTDGTTIKHDLNLLISGELDAEQINELLSHLVRDGDVSTAAIPALAFLTGDLVKIPPDSRLNCRYADCLIVCHAAKHEKDLKLEDGDTFDALRNESLKQLLQEASNHNLSCDWMVSIAAVILLMNNDEDSYKKLVTSGYL